MFLARLSSLFQSERKAHRRRLRRGGFRPVLETLECRQVLSGCAPVVVTDRAEYLRGETVEISGSCFQTGEQVTLQVVHTDGTTGGAGHEPWNAVADVDGVFHASWYVDPDDSANEQFTLTAQGDLGSHATAEFSDPFLRSAVPTVRTAVHNISQTVAISGRVFYDANGNTLADDRTVLGGWAVTLDPGCDGDASNDLVAITNRSGDYVFNNLAPGTYCVRDGIASGWVQTSGVEGYTVVAVAGQHVSLLDFGNLELTAGSGGQSIGSWSNKNGRNLLFDEGEANSELTLLNSLHLVTASGADLDLSMGTVGYGELKSWLQGATATNMAYMLSAQLAATALSCEAGALNGATVIDVGDTLDGFYDQINATLGAGTVTEIGSHAFLTIDQLQTAANLALEHDGSTPAGDAWRAYQEALKNALDKLNNNRLLFVV